MFRSLKNCLVYACGCVLRRCRHCGRLSVCLENTQTLVSLSLQCNLLDDDLVEILMEGLSQNKTLSILDLSHNKISDTGAQMLGALCGCARVYLRCVHAVSVSKFYPLSC